MLLIEEKGSIVEVSESIERMFDYTQDSLSGADAAILIAERSRPRFMALQTLASRDRQHLFVGIEEGVFGMHQKHGEFVIEIEMTPLEYDDKKMVLLTFHDRTLQSNADRNVNETLVELRRSNRDLQQFAYVASHDLQTPLRHIASFVELLSKKLKLEEDPEAHRWISFITNATVNMRALIDDLLAFSRVRAGEHPFEKVDMASLWSLVETSAKQEQPTCSMTAGELPMVVGHSYLLLQLLHNLMQNSLKFSRAGQPTCIDFSCQEQGSHYLFEFRDNGIGIAPEHYERVFLLFQKLHGKEKYSGTGIGLAICKKVVEIHGGSIWIESNLGSGTSFFFTLRSANGVHENKDGINPPG